MSITSRINEMSSHIEQAYDELQGLGADLTGINKNIENISIVLDDIYDSMPQVSGEGTSLTLEDTRVGKIKSTLKGNTSQTTYSGKNIINYVDNLRTSYSGLTSVINKDGSITTTGIPNSDYRCIVEYNINSSLENGETYTLWQETPQAHLLYLQINAIKKDGTGTSYYSLNTGNDYIQIPNVNKETYNYVLNIQTEQTSSWGTSSRTITNKYMLEKGNKTSFEPYTGGTASPNPSYPQPVNVVSGDNEIVINGKNKLSPTLNDINETISGVKREGTNGTYTLSGTATAGAGGNVRYTLTNTYTIQNGDYLHLCNSTINTNSTIMIFNENDTQINNWSFNVINRVIDISSYAGQKIKSIGFYNNSSFSGSLTTSPMIINSNTVTNYEPYQGNTYNIDLPVENLFDKSRLVSGKRLDSSGEPSINAEDYVTTDYFIVVEPSTTYYSTALFNQSKCVCLYDSLYNHIERLFNLNSRTFTTTSSTKFIKISILSSEVNTEQLEKGSKANSYTPYGTTPIELCKIGNYQDYFYKENDKWYLHKEIGKVVLNGSEIWFKSSAYSTSTYLAGYTPAINTLIKNNSYNVMCNNFTLGLYISVRDNECIANNGETLNIQILASRLSENTADALKTWLSTHNTEVYYVLATPTNTEITYQPLIDQLNLLEKAQSKDGQTNISQVNNDLPFIISASALKEWQESASLNSTLSMVNPLSLGNTLNTQENNTQPIEVDNIEPLEEEENEES